MLFCELNEKEFEQFSTSYPEKNIWQTTQMAHLREKRGFTVYYVGIKEEDKIIAAAMLTSNPSLGKYLSFQSVRGFLIDYSNTELLTFFHHHLIEFIKQKNGMVFRIDPYLPYVERDLDGNEVKDGFSNRPIFDTFLSLGYKHTGFFRGNINTLEPRWMYQIPYKGRTPEELLASFERKTIRSIHKAEKYHVTVRELPFDQLDLFMKVMDHTEKRRGFTGRGKEYYENLYKIYKDDITFLYTELKVDDYIASLQEDLNEMIKEKETAQKKYDAMPSTKMQNKLQLASNQVDQLHEKIQEAQKLKETDGEVLVLASGAFFTYGDETMCLISGVYDKYMKFAAPYAMHWYMMKKSIAMGQKRYNLYGISGIFDESADDYGVYLFKKGFNGEVIELMGVFDYVVNPFMYKVYDSLRNIKHKILK